MTAVADPEAEAAQPVSDIPAERYVLSSMMWAPLAIDQVADVLVPKDFYRTFHQDLYEAMQVMHAGQLHIDPVTLRAYLQRNRIPDNPGYIAELGNIHPVVEGAAQHAELIWDCSVRRQTAASGHRLVQGAGEMWRTPQDLIAWSQETLADLAGRSASSGQEQALTPSMFMADETIRQAPVIPGLLDRKDRVVAVAAEGAGKSMVSAQVAFALAAGVHPFWPSFTYPPGRALIIDLENPGGLLQRRIEMFMKVASQYPAFREENIQIWSRPEGCNVLDRRLGFMLLDVIRRARPDFVAIGPVYKMHPHQEKVEHLHFQVSEWLNQVLRMYSPALWIETHAPMASGQQTRLLRPRDSGVWGMWTDFGISLARGKDNGLTLGRFKGDREEGRSWPVRLTRTPRYGHAWPWEAEYPTGTIFDEAGR